MTARTQFAVVYQRGRRVQRGALTVFALPNDHGHCRLGLTVTRKVGGAVRRNRVKRILREIFRRNGERWDLPLDLVVNTHPTILTRPATEVERDFTDCLVELARRSRPCN